MATWSVLGLTATGYSPTVDPISRLAAVGAPTRPMMTAGLAAYALAVAAFASAVGPRLGRVVAATAGLNAAATVAVAVTPLDGAFGGTPHAIAAATGYVTLAALPLFAMPRLRRLGFERTAITGAIVAASTGAALAVSAGVSTIGLWQRIGLTVGDLWLIAVSVALVATEPGVPSGLRSIPDRQTRSAAPNATPNRTHQMTTVG